MTGEHNTGNAVAMRQVAMAALIALLLVPAAWGRGQRGGAPAFHSAPARHASAGPSQAARSQAGRVQYARPQNQGQTQGYAVQRAAPSYPATAPRPAYQGSATSGPAYPGYARPAYSNPGAAPPGHLGAWLNEHRNVPVQEQERMLRSDPSFNRLPSAAQQRLVQQLHQVNQLPEEQRQRRLARAEALEHMSPQDRMRANLSGRRLATLPADRQALMGRAFQDLRSVPLEQRQMVLNSSRYQGAFSPEERGILSDLLRAEPYEPARP